MTSDVVRPGTVSCFWPNSGTQKEWTSSGAARNFQTEYAIAAATTAKMTMQITVTNQKTKSIRPASRPAGCGSQGGTSASAVATPPATRAKMTSWTTDPRRTAHEPTSRRERLASRTADCDTTATSAPDPGPSPFLFTTPCTSGSEERKQEVRWDSELESSWWRSARS